MFQMEIAHAAASLNPVAQLSFDTLHLGREALSRRMLDLLPDRTAETLADWLHRQPQIAVVARDRSSEYARGILLGAPTATQVAYRWHVLVNLRQAVDRWP